jgi:hypothetical protein
MFAHVGKAMTLMHGFAQASSRRLLQIWAHTSASNGACRDLTYKRMIHALNRDGFDLTALSEGSAHLSEVTLTGSLGQ